jgi:hypothetical protein
MCPLRIRLVVAMLAALTTVSTLQRGAAGVPEDPTPHAFVCVDGRLPKSGLRLTPLEERAVRLALGEEPNSVDKVLLSALSKAEAATNSEQNQERPVSADVLLRRASELEKQAQRTRLSAHRRLEDTLMSSNAPDPKPAVVFSMLPAELKALEKEKLAAKLRYQARGKSTRPTTNATTLDLTRLSCFGSEFPAPRRSPNRVFGTPRWPTSGFRAVGAGKEGENSGEEAQITLKRWERERLFLSAPFGTLEDLRSTVSEAKLREAALRARIVQLGFGPNDIHTQDAGCPPLSQPGVPNITCEA